MAGTPLEPKHRNAIKGVNLEDVSYSETTGLATVGEDGEITASGATPLFVEDASIPGAKQIPGYIPNKKRRAIMHRRGQIRRAQEQKKKYDADSLVRKDIPLITGPPGFVNGKISKEVRDRKEDKVMEVAKRIRDKRKRLWKKYKKAEELVGNYEAQLADGKDPKLNALLREAIALRKGSPPASYKKEICMAAARIQVYQRS